MEEEYIFEEDSVVTPEENNEVASSDSGSSEEFSSELEESAEEATSEETSFTISELKEIVAELENEEVSDDEVIDDEVVTSENGEMVEVASEPQEVLVDFSGIEERLDLIIDKLYEEVEVVPEPNIMEKSISDYTVSESLILCLVIGVLGFGLVMIVRKGLPKWR